MKIAVPVADGRLHGHFGGARQFAIVEVDQVKRLVVSSSFVEAPPHEPGLFPRWLRAQGVQVILAGGIGQRALNIFAQEGIEVRAGTPEAPLDMLISAYLNDELTGAPSGCTHHHDHDHDHDHDHADHH
jgi:predicted Fe-Mo cluster-binding NifX family protein